MFQFKSLYCVERAHLLRTWICSMFFRTSPGHLNWYRYNAVNVVVDVVFNFAFKP